MNREEEEWAEGDYLDWLDFIDEELSQDPNYPYKVTPASPKEVSEEEKKRLKQERMHQKVEAAKKIKWKIISRNYEYEVIVGGEVLGKVVNSNGKWVVQPEFNWNEDSYRNNNLAKSKYKDFRDSGKALVDLWCLT